VANIDFTIDIANVFNLMIYRSSLINSPMDVVSIESSTSYSEQGHNDEVSLVTYTFPQITYLNMAMEVISNLPYYCAEFSILLISESFAMDLFPFTREGMIQTCHARAARSQTHETILTVLLTGLLTEACFAISSEMLSWRQLCTKKNLPRQEGVSFEQQNRRDG
jgi:hypothetical protein